MIVRGSVLSDKRVTLESALAERPTLAAVRAVSSIAPEDPPAREPSVAAMPAPALAPVPQSVPAPPRPITFEAVAKWLDTQSETTRTRLAELLADDVEQIQSAAREEGRQAGHAAGREEAAFESERLLTVLTEINGVAQAALAEDGAKLADQCAEIVAVALTRIAGAKLVTPKATLGIVNEILKRVTDERELIVRVSAADLPALQEQKEKLGAAVAGRALTLMADPRVQLGGAMVESKLGSLDGRLEVQLRALFDTLQAAKSAPKEAP